MHDRSMVGHLAESWRAVENGERAHRLSSTNLHLLHIYDPSEPIIPVLLLRNCYNSTESLGTSAQQRPVKRDL